MSNRDLRQFNTRLTEELRIGVQQAAADEHITAASWIRKTLAKTLVEAGYVPAHRNVSNKAA